MTVVPEVHARHPHRRRDGYLTIATWAGEELGNRLPATGAGKKEGRRRLSDHEGKRRPLAGSPC